MPGIPKWRIRIDPQREQDLVLLAHAPVTGKSLIGPIRR